MVARKKKSTAPLAVVAPSPAKPPQPCGICGRGDLWISIYGPVICLSCHPPAAESLVAERVQVEPRPRALPVTIPPAAQAESYYGTIRADRRDEAVETEEEGPPPWSPEA